MPNRVTAATHEQRSLVPRHTRLLKLRSGEGEIVGGRVWRGGFDGRASSETAGTHWRQPARH